MLSAGNLRAHGTGLGPPQAPPGGWGLSTNPPLPRQNVQQTTAGSVLSAGNLRAHGTGMGPPRAPQGGTRQSTGQPLSLQSLAVSKDADGSFIVTRENLAALNNPGQPPGRAQQQATPPPRRKHPVSAPGKAQGQAARYGLGPGRPSASRKISAASEPLIGRRREKKPPRLGALTTMDRSTVIHGIKRWENKIEKEDYRGAGPAEARQALSNYMDRYKQVTGHAYRQPCNNVARGTIFRKPTSEDLARYKRHRSALHDEMTEASSAWIASGKRNLQQKNRMRKAATSLAAYESMSKGERLLDEYASERVGPIKKRKERSDWNSMFLGARTSREHLLQRSRRTSDKFEKSILDYKITQRQEEEKRYQRYHFQGRPFTLERSRSRSLSPVTESSKSSTKSLRGQGPHVGDYGFEGTSHHVPYAEHEEQPKDTSFPLRNSSPSRDTGQGYYDPDYVYRSGRGGMRQPQRRSSRPQWQAEARAEEVYRFPPMLPPPGYVPYSPPRHIRQLYPGPPPPRPPFGRPPVPPPQLDFQYHYSPARGQGNGGEPNFVSQASSDLSQLSLGNSGGNLRPGSQATQQQNAHHAYADHTGQQSPYIDPLGISDRFRYTHVPEMDSLPPSPPRSRPQSPPREVQEYPLANEAGGPLPLHGDGEESEWTAPHSSFGGSQYSSQHRW